MQEEIQRRLNSGGCLLLFSAKSVVFQFGTQKHEGQNKQKYTRRRYVVKHNLITEV